MKILVFTTLFPNKMMTQHGLFIKARVAALAKTNDVRVVAPVPFFPRWNINSKWFLFSQIPLEEEIDGIKIYHPRYLVIPKIGRFLYGFLMFWSLRGFIQDVQRSFDFDMIDAHVIYPDGLAALLIARSLKKRVILNGRGTDLNWYPQFPVIRAQIRSAMEKADAVTVVTETLQEKTIELGIDRGKVTVIPNGVDTGTFCFRPQDEAKRMLNIPDNRRVILAVGHLLEAKGFHLLIEALRHVRRQDIDLVIIGDGKYKEKLQQLAADHHMGERVKFPGERPQNELALWYAAADMFCLTSLREGRPNVVLEALACGAPVISMNQWGLGSLVDAESGILLESYEPSDIAQAIDRALQKNWDRRAISDSMKEHTWDRTAEQVERLMASVMAKKDILFFSSDDWNSGLKTSKYHLSTRLARGNRVMFINSLGLRSPTFSKSDARKIFVKLRGYFKGVQKVRNNLYVYTPILIPFQSFAFIRLLNKCFLLWQFRWLMVRYGITQPDIWTFLPNTVDLVTKLPRRKLIYYCVDDMSAFQGVAADVILRQDEDLTRKADEVFAVSEELYRQKKQWNPRTHYSPHGVDFDLFNQACRDGSIKKPEDLKNIKGPIIGFYGLISGDWIDYGLVEYLAQNRPQWSLVLIGKIDRRGDAKLPQRDNIHYLPVKPYEELYRYSRFFDVAILPFNINPLTMRSHPLKILEYLSAGRPVVSVNIPETEKYARVIAVASDHADFLDKIENYLRHDQPEQQKARVELAATNSWDKRFDEIQNIVDNGR